ncbi:MAG: hypothetical protein HYX84_03455 [Chloroflexi bacterium]|nr:hypothetical protein [Chloroflexota bacterium]
MAVVMPMHVGDWDSEGGKAESAGDQSQQAEAQSPDTAERNTTLNKHRRGQPGPRRLGLQPLARSRAAGGGSSKPDWGVPLYRDPFPPVWGKHPRQ